MEKETLRFHKGLRAIILPDGRRLSSDQKRVFVEPPQSLQPATSQAAGGPRTSRTTSVANAAIKAKRTAPTKAAVPVGPAATPETAVSPPDSGQQPNLQKEKAALEEAMQALRVRVDSLLGKISNTMTEFVAAQKIQLQELEKPTLEIAMCIAEHVVGQCVDTQQLNMQPLIANAIQQLGSSEEVRVKLNNEDLAAIQATGADLESLGKHVSLVPDMSLPVGSCVVEASGHVMASTIRHRLDNARRLVTEEFQNGRV